MSDPIVSATLSRFVAGLAYVLAVSVVGAMIYSRHISPPPIAARDLDRNHRLAPGDLENSDIKPLLGQFLRKAVKQGKPVTASMLAAKELPANVANTMAAVVTMPARTVKSKKIDRGSSVRICLKKEAFGDVSKVLDVDCDELICAVLVRMAKVPSKPADPDMSIARLVTDGQDCSKP
jgi:hypothetical protein